VRDTLQHNQNRLQGLFLVALFGVLFAVGVAVAELAGTWAALAYSVVAVGLVVVGAARARAAQERGRRAAGRTCTCCTATQHDPVKVI
jgi:membrane protein implicated in regulation of membrane protease activity